MSTYACCRELSYVKQILIPKFLKQTLQNIFLIIPHILNGLLDTMLSKIPSIIGRTRAVTYIVYRSQRIVGKTLDMIRKYHNHTLQINQRHQKEDQQNTNSHMTSGRQLK